MNTNIVVSGIQPSGKLHIGNYLGALHNFIELQGSGEYECYFFIADYHSLTENYSPDTKRSQIIDLAATYLAAGLNPKLSTLFIQSHVPTHANLSWILTTLTPMGELSRMTQYKDKAKQDNNVGLFTYPVLMAADILLYDATHVPVGDDQDQHLELTRTLARKFNTQFGDLLVEPQPLYTSIPRLMSLNDPSKKMSKSKPEGCLFIDDDPETAKKKISRAVTDSGNEIKYDPKQKPGVSNLLLIASAFTSRSPQDIAAQLRGKSYSALKKFVAERIIAYFTPIRQAKQELLQDPDKVLKIFVKGGKAATKVADKKLDEVKQTIGLL
ncbi:MAG: tryptophan--tRNA ligase [Candidatus Harrisonbacteria bacterium CG10_big_fil_rev_8_21_14_0_10_49_15]|uniref:Tryptophan--tRNA ligase n=1 Tax=Candidatus Harrisonbacteria bacterium CG10_big_fil_rev_8_21_14_0_10_49_15 TaxID=1974587 RepID=A0A2H0ULP8_9BACT|nr:MAG: tryptophan--tRNA ligase [Candidatus Harrisonbacteria bacterium CG10_big_fil_rev_8_21_14_0_10_49_15]